MRNIGNVCKMHNMTNLSDSIRVNSTELRRDARKLLDHIMRGGRAEIDRHGEPIAVMVPKRSYDHMVTELEDLRGKLQQERAARKTAEAAACLPESA